MSELDSTTDVKYSKHIIISLGRYKFRNNIDVGDFVNQLRQKIEEDPEGVFPIIYAPKNKIGKAEFLDNSIYKKNRNFRIIGSSKYVSRGSNPLRLYDSLTKIRTDISDLSFSNFTNTLALHFDNPEVSSSTLTINKTLTFAKVLDARGQSIN